jgi:hypothetical protein
VPLGPLWQRAPKERAGIFLIGKVGIGCPTCEAKLRVIQGGIVIATVGSFAALCAAFGALGAIEHAKPGAAKQDLNLLLLVPSIVAWMLLFKRYGHRFARLRAVADGEKVVVFPVSKPLLEQPTGREGPDVGARSQVTDKPADSAECEKTAWVCPECGEENPGQYDICCICETKCDSSEQR